MRWQPHRRPASEDRSTRRTAAIAVVVTSCYLAWRASTLGGGVTLWLSVPLLVAEIWGLLQLSALTYQGWRATPARLAPSRTDRAPAADIVVVGLGRGVDDIERTLVGCSLIAGSPQIVVLDGSARPQVAALAQSFGATYRDGHETAIDAAMAGIVRCERELVVWLEAGQVPMPDLVSSAAPRFSDRSVSVVQLGVDLLNPDSLTQQQRGRDEAALARSVTGPGLARRGYGPWTGSASIVRRSAIVPIADLCRHHLGVGAALVELHRQGWRSDYEHRELVRATAPDTLGDYLTQRRQQTAGVLSVLATRQNPLTCRGLPRAARLAQLTMIVAVAPGLRQLLGVGVLIATLLIGRLPFDAGVVNVVSAWLAAGLAGAVARNRLGRGTMGWGDWVRQAWRTAGADLGAVLDVVGRRTPVAAGSPAATGLRALGRLGLLSTTVFALDVALLARSATLVDPELLPAFTTGGRLIVIGAALAVLIPMIDVLQVIVRRTQRRGSYRLPVELAVAWEGQAGRSVDLTPDGIGVMLERAVPVGTVGRFQLELPRIDGTTEEIAGQAEIQSALTRPDGKVRVGLALRELDDDARRALIRFYTVERGRPRDRRSRSRIETTLPCRLTEVPCETVDLTPDSVGIRAERGAELGARLQLDVDLPRPGEQPQSVRATLLVKSSARDEHHLFHIGGELVDLAPETRAALIRYCAIDHRRLAAHDDVPLIAPGELTVDRAPSRHHAHRSLTAAAFGLGVATLLFGPAVSSATAAVGPVATACIRDSAGAAVPGASIRWRVAGGEWSPAVQTDGSGCLDDLPATGPTDVEARADNVATVISQDLSVDPAIELSTVETAVCVTDAIGSPIAGAPVRYAGDGWTAAGATDGSGRLELELLPADLVIEVATGGGRAHRALAAGDPRTVQFGTVRLLADAGASLTEVDLGTGWQPFTAGMEVLPGRIAIRRSDGSTIKLEAVAGSDLGVPSGTLSAVPSSPTCPPPVTASTTTSTTSTTAAPSSSLVSAVPPTVADPNAPPSTTTSPTVSAPLSTTTPSSTSAPALDQATTTLSPGATTTSAAPGPSTTAPKPPPNPNEASPGLPGLDAGSVEP